MALRRSRAGSRCGDTKSVVANAGTTNATNRPACMLAARYSYHDSQRMTG